MNPNRDFHYTELLGGVPLASGPDRHWAQALIEEALLRMGAPIDHGETWDWRTVSAISSYGEAAVDVAIVDRGTDSLALLAIAPILEWPENERLQGELGETLLRLNYEFLTASHLAIALDSVVLIDIRPIEGLTTEAVQEALVAILRTAIDLGPRLRADFALALPQIPLDERTYFAVRDLYRGVSPEAQVSYSALLEDWHARGGQTDTTGKTLRLLGAASGSVVAVLIGHASAGPIVTVSWNSLERTYGVRPEDADAFRAAVPRPEGFELTASSAHLPVEALTPTMIVALVDALALLDDAMTRAVKPGPPPVPDLHARWGLAPTAGKATLRNVDATLETCPDAVRPTFIRLIERWQAAGLAVYTNNPHLVYLRLTVPGETPGLTTTYAAVTLRAPDGKRGARVDVACPWPRSIKDDPEAGRLVETLAHLPGYTPRDDGFRLDLRDPLSDADLQSLGDGLIGLAAHYSRRDL